jgi:membrane protein DedA with SNARE-associated domain
MASIENLLVSAAKFSTETISSFGYLGIFLLMTAESTMIPLPSELVMPFAGYLAYTGQFSFLLVIIIASLGTIAGSLLSYFIGKYGGEPFLENYGRYLLVNKKDLAWTHSWFRKKGELTIFISRFVPVVRHLISIPAGIAEMDIKKFTIYTFAGGLIWNTALAYAGYLLGKNWEMIHEYTKPISYAMAAVIIIGIIYFVYKHLHRKA